MEMLQLRYFFESARTQSFAKTAEKYAVPATSVSASIKRLEKELGCELFHRSCNRITLNDNGKRLQQSLRVVFDELDRAVESLSAASTDNREIKMLVRAMRSEITDLIIEYKEKHPHVAFKMVFDFDETDFESYDIIIDEKTDKYPKYEEFELYNTRIRLTVCSKSPLCGKKLTLKQLSDQPFISIGEHNSISKLLIKACKQAGFTPNFVVRSNDLQCNRKFVESGIGIGLFREYPQKTVPSNRVCLDITDFNQRQTICSYYKKQSAFGSVKHFLNFLKAKAGLL